MDGGEDRGAARKGTRAACQRTSVPRASVSRERDAENPNADLSYKKITLPLGPNTYRRTYTADTHPPENVNVLYMCSFIKKYCNRMYLR